MFNWFIYSICIVLMFLFTSDFNTIFPLNLIGLFDRYAYLVFSKGLVCKIWSYNSTYSNSELSSAEDTDVFIKEQKRLD